jgi:hypothetical protein
MAPNRAHPHCTNHKQGEMHISCVYVQTSDIGSTAWGRGLYGCTGKFSYPTWSDAGKEGNSNVKIVSRGKVLLSFFPINMYAPETN